MGDRVIGKIYETDNLDKFRRVKGNREISNRASRYRKSIAKDGQLVPIIVNELWEICEGQARFACCKELGLPVKYIICPGYGLEDTITMNVNSSKWKSSEIVHGRAETGDLASQYVDALKKMFPKFDLSVIYYALTGRRVSGQDIANTIQGSTVRVKDYDTAVEMLDFVQKATNAIKSVPGRRREFQIVILWLLRNNKVRKERLLEVCSTKVSMLQPMPNMKIAAEEVQKIYNHSCRQRVLFAQDMLEEFREAKK